MYTVTYQEDVISDIQSLGTSEKRRIKNAIESKLMQSPVQFGNPPSTH